MILDQAEEAFTRPRVAAPAGTTRPEEVGIDPDAELAELLAALRATSPARPAAAPGQAHRQLPQRVARPVEQAFNAVSWAGSRRRSSRSARRNHRGHRGALPRSTLKRRYEPMVAEGLAATIAEDLVIDAGRPWPPLSRSC